MNKYIDAEKLIKAIEDKGLDCSFAIKMERLDTLALIDELQQEQPEGNLEYWLEYFGMPKGNIDNCITQIAQGYGACRYLEGIQHGAEAVNELAKQEQPEGGCSEKPNDLLSERAEPRKTRKQEQPESFSYSHENDNEPPHAGIEGVVHHYANVHYININTEQLNARIKQFPEGTEVEIYIQRKEN